jgi:hypothetical protein
MAYVTVAATLVALAAVAVAVVSWRRAYGGRRAALRQAIEINDDIVQGLALAQYRYEAGDVDAAHQAVVETLAAARTLMSDLVDRGPGRPVAPGDLVRSVPAQPVGSPDDRAVAGR